MIRVLFVCLSNICRSPMAEAIFRHKIKEAGLSHIMATDSAGTGDWHAGEAPHTGTRNMLKKYKIDYNGIRARQVLSSDIADFNYILAMDAQNLSDLQTLAGNQNTAHVFKMLEFASNKGAAADDVPDPYYTGNFEEVYALLDAGCSQLLEEIRNREKL